jgi:signal transduction histidine kinase
MLNLIVNAFQAMSGVSVPSRELLIGSAQDAATGVLVTVQDSGPGLNPESFDHLFDAFYTTKTRRHGHGTIDLPLIIEAHGGQVWATANVQETAAYLRARHPFRKPAWRERPNR